MSILDFRDELYSKTFRRMFVLEFLYKRKRSDNGVSMQKAAFADILLCNPSLLQKVLSSIGRPQLPLAISEFLYPNNIDTGAATHTIDFAQTILILHKNSLVRIEKIVGDISIWPTFNPLPENTYLAKQWTKDLGEITPLMSKSNNVLLNKILENANGNHSIFNYTKAPD